ncbi:MAG: GGDEF domain-containing protein [Chromatiaceae bacterium]
MFLLGTIRTATDAEVTFTSAALLPVLVAAWFGGSATGVIIANFAVAMWLVLDLAAGWHFSAAWVPWGNLVARLIVYNIVALLVGQVRSQFDCEREYATHDTLTGLNNRRGFFDEGCREVQRSRRYPRPLAMILLDLDNFKELNDSQGHDIGDFALQATAQAMLGTVRSSNCVARLGGDEFAILLLEVDSPDAVAVADKILTAVKERLSSFPPVTASLGLAWFSASDQPFPAMLKAADELMYEAKQSGKGAVRSRLC